MAFDFPASPSIDQDYVAGTVTYTYNGTGWVLKGTSAGQFVSKSGDTMTGDLLINKDTPIIRLNATGVTNASLYLNNVGGTQASDIWGLRSGANRWLLRLGDGTAESGSDIGSNFSIMRWSDAGSPSIPFIIYRNTGLAEFFNNVKVSGTTASTSPTTGAFTVAGGVGIGGALQVGNVSGAGVWVTGWDQNGATNLNGALWLGANTAYQGRVRYDALSGAGILYVDNTQDNGASHLVLRTRTSGATPQTITMRGDTGALQIASTAASTSPTTGALTVAGGLGVGNNVYAGGDVQATGVVRAGAYPGLTTASYFSANLQYISGWKAFVAGPGHMITLDSGNQRVVWYVAPNTAAGGEAAIADAVYINCTDRKVEILASVASTSTTTGGLVVRGGVGVGGNIIQAAGGFHNFGLAPNSNPGIGNTINGIEMTGGTTAGYLAISNNVGANCGFFLNCNVDGILASFRRAGTQVGGITVAGSVTTYNTSSDMRLKEDLKSFDAGNIIDGTEMYDFAWKDSGERSYGALAQDVNKIYPQAVTCDNDWWGIDYSKFVPLLLQELKAVRNRLKQLEDK